MKTFEDFIKEMNKGVEEFSTIFTKEFDNKTNKLNELFDQIKKDRIQNDKDNQEFLSNKLIKHTYKDDKLYVKINIPGFDKSDIKITKNSIKYMINAINGEIRDKESISFLIDDKYNVLHMTEYRNGVLTFIFDKKEETKDNVIEIKIDC